MAVPFAEFGSSNEALYLSYLSTFDGARDCVLGEWPGVLVGTLGSAARNGGGNGRGRESRFGFTRGAGACTYGSRSFGRRGWSGGVGRSSGGGWTIDDVVGVGGGSAGSAGVAADVTDACVVDDSGSGGIDGDLGCSGVSDRVAEEDVGVGSGRGPNWVRNQAWKVRRRDRKLRKQSGVASELGGGSQGSTTTPAWRKSAGPLSDEVPLSSDSGRVDRKGYFSQCSEETQRALRESRAALLVAENERKLKVEQNKLKELSGDLAGVVELVRALKQIAELQKVSKDTAVGGWAKTLCESVQKSVSAAVSTPDSVPTLEEVGFGVDAATAGSVDARKIEYNMRKELLEASYEAADSFFPEDRIADFRDLDEEFGDVLGKPDDIVKRNLRREFFEAGAVTKDQQLAVMFSLVGIENKYY